MTLYRVELLIETPYNPAKWNWDELVASEDGENVEHVSVKVEKDTEHLETVTCSECGRVGSEAAMCWYNYAPVCPKCFDRPPLTDGIAA